jgi:uncharacterized OB-fold protein
MTGPEPFLHGLQRGELLLPWCRSCGKYHFYPRYACPFCWGEDYDWRRALGTGSLYTFALVRSNPPTRFRDRLPYIVAIVDLDEGVRLLTEIVGPAEGMEIGDRVHVEYVERDGQVLPLFRRLA